MNIPNWLRNLPARAKEWAGKAGRSIKTATSAAFYAVKKEIISLFQWTVKIVRNMWRASVSLFHSTSRFIKEKWLFAKQVIKAAWEGFKEWANKTVRSIHAWMLSLTNSVKEWYTRLKESKEMQKKADRLLVAGLVIVASFVAFSIMKSAAGAVTEIEIPWKTVGMVMGGVIALAVLSSIAKKTSADDVKSALSKATGNEFPLGMVFTSLFVFAGFNLALWAGMSAVGGEHGKHYFTSEWLLSPAFILLGVIAVAKAFPSHKDNRFGFLALPIALFALVAGVVTVWPGFFPRNTAKVLAEREAHASLSPVRYENPAGIAESPQKLPDSPARLFNGPGKEMVEKFFYHPEDSIMVAIAACESRFRQFDENGGVLRGKNAPGIADDLGIFQINEGYHRDSAIALGFNIETLEGNVAYADHLFREERTVPWESSAWCWRDHLDRDPKGPSSIKSTYAISYGDTVEVTAPAGGAWSAPIETWNKKIRWTDRSAGIPWEIMDDRGQVYDPFGRDLRLGNPKHLRVRSLSEEPVILFITAVR